MKTGLLKRTTPDHGFARTVVRQGCRYSGALIFFIAAACFCASQAWAAIYYVATNHASASDSNSGASDSVPMKTIQHAVDVAVTGDRIIVREGIYNERIKFTSNDAGIALVASSFVGQPVQVNGFNTRNAGGLMIDSFTVVNPPASGLEEDRCGIFVASDGVCLAGNNILNIHGPAILMDKTKPWHTGVSFYRNKIDGCNQGIVGYAIHSYDADSNLINGVDLQENEIKHLVVYPDSNLDPVYIKLMGSEMNIWGTKCFGTSASDTAGKTAKVFDTSEADGGYARNIFFYNNIFKDFDVIADIKSDTPNNSYGITFFDNLFIRGRKSGFTVTGYIHSLSLLNNLFYETGSHAVGFKVGLASGYNPGDSAKYNYAVNNIFYNTGTQPVWVETTGQLSWTAAGYNLSYSTAGSIAKLNEHDVVNLDPRFVDAAHDNFHLLEGSPAIDAGAALSGGAIYDFDYVPRPQGAAFDIGPFEFQKFDSGTIDPNIVPVITVIRPANLEGYEGQEYIFNMDASYLVSGGRIYANPNYYWVWDFGDGTTFFSGSSIGKTYKKRGFYTLTLKVIDNATGKMGIAQKPVTVWPPAIPDCMLRLHMNGDIRDYSGKKIETQWQGIGTPVFGSGTPGKAITLDGTSSGPYVVAKHNDLLDGIPAATLGLFAKKTIASASGPILRKQGVYSIELQSQGVTATVYNASGGLVTLSAPSANNGDTRWHHYCITYDGASARLYFDGVQVDTKALSGNLAHNIASDLFLGKNPSGNAFNGSLDTIRFYNRPLTAAEVLFLFSGTQFGDVSLNATVSAYDAAMAAKYSVGSQILTSQQVTQADVSADGTVSSFDASLIARYSVGLVQKFEADVNGE